MSSARKLNVISEKKNFNTFRPNFQIIIIIFCFSVIDGKTVVGVAGESASRIVDRIFEQLRFCLLLQGYWRCYVE